MIVSQILLRILLPLFEILKNKYGTCVLLIYIVKTWFSICLHVCSDTALISPCHSQILHSFNSVRCKNASQRITILEKPFLSCPSLSYQFFSTQSQQSSISNGEGRKNLISALTPYFPKGNSDYQVLSWFL